MYGAFAQQYILANSSSSTFTDVPATHPLYKYIQALYDAGYTAGCSSSPMMFCPDTILDRAQSALFMLRGQMGSGYTRPAGTGIFGDNWTGSEWAQGWAEGMYQEGLTTGCQSSPLLFCPANQLPRVEASIFGLRMKYGVAYVPPAATGTLFADFPSTDPSYWGIDWAEQAYNDGLLPACGTDTGTGKPMFCPSELVNRGWGAYLIVKAKNLPTTSQPDHVKPMRQETDLTEFATKEILNDLLSVNHGWWCDFIEEYIDKNGKVKQKLANRPYFSPTFLRMYGYSAEEMSPKLIFRDRETQRNVYREISEVMRPGSEAQTTRRVAHTKSGDKKLVEEYVRRIDGPDGTALLASLLSDLTFKRHAVDRAERPRQTPLLFLSRVGIRSKSDSFSPT